MYLAVYRANDRICTSKSYEDKKEAVKFACRKIIEGYDCVVLTEEEHEKLMLKREKRGVVHA